MEQGAGAAVWSSAASHATRRPQQPPLRSPLSRSRIFSYLQAQQGAGEASSATRPAGCRRRYRLGAAGAPQSPSLTRPRCGARPPRSPHARNATLTSRCLPGALSPATWLWLPFERPAVPLPAAACDGISCAPPRSNGVRRGRLHLPRAPLHDRPLSWWDRCTSCCVVLLQGCAEDTAAGDASCSTCTCSAPPPRRSTRHAGHRRRVIWNCLQGHCRVEK